MAGVLCKTVDNKSSVKWVESGLELRGTLSIILRFVTRSVTCFIYPLLLAPCHLKCIIATGICREPVVRVTFVIKIKGLWVGQILLASFQWVKVGRVLCALPKQKFPNKMVCTMQKGRSLHLYICSVSIFLLLLSGHEPHVPKRSSCCVAHTEVQSELEGRLH